jgi:hypothetical protein
MWPGFGLAGAGSFPHGLELPGPGLRPKQAPGRSGGFFPGILMKTIRPDNTDPIPLRSSPHRVGTIMLRFAGLLFVAMVVLALAWNR